MSTPLRLFIAPPYTPWTLVTSYGTQPAPSNGSVLPPAGYTLLRTQSATLNVLAGADGKLSIHPPAELGVDRGDDVNEFVEGAEAPISVTLYLHVGPRVAGDADLRTRTAIMNSLLAFQYVNL